MGRCWIDPFDAGHDRPAGPCWHVRTAAGKPFARGVADKLWVSALHRALQGPRVAWLLGRPDEPLRPGRIVYRGCGTHDCVHPGHMRQGSPRQASIAAKRRGCANTPAKRAHLEALAASRRHIGAELQAWVYESGQTDAELGRVLGIDRKAIGRARRRESDARARLAAASVFRMGQFVGGEVCVAG